MAEWYNDILEGQAKAALELAAAADHTTKACVEARIEKLASPSTLAVLDEIWYCLDSVVQYGLRPMDRMDAEKVVTALALVTLLRNAQKGGR
jgi:hypothetical protein